MEYRADQILNRMTTHPTMKLKIQNENSETKWMDITPQEARQIAELLSGEVMDGWSVDDVLSLDDKLTREEAKQILQIAVDDHDATIGINWDVLQYHIDQFREEQKNAK